MNPFEKESQKLLFFLADEFMYIHIYYDEQQGTIEVV